MTSKVTEFLREKWRLAFRFFDVNHDGVLTKEDFLAIADNVSKATNASEQQANTTKEEWQKQFSYVQPDPSIIVDEKRYVSVGEFMNQDIDNHRKVIGSTATDMFDAIDLDKDGVISIKEFELFYNACGKTNEQALETFTKIDADSNGLIERDEFVDDVVRYFTDSDPVTGRAYICG